MPNATNITYGSYDFQRDAGPVPLLTIRKDFRRFGDGLALGSTFAVTLNGSINFLPSGLGGYKNVDNWQDVLLSGFKNDCQEFKVTCGADTLIQAYPRVNGISFSPTKDNWTDTTEFTIELEWPGETYTGLAGSSLNLDSASETWDFTLDNRNSYYSFASGSVTDNNMHLFSLNHEVTAKATDRCSNRPAWHDARKWVISRLGYGGASGIVQGSGVFNLNAATFSGWNHSRVQHHELNDGVFRVSETWLVADSGYQSNCGAGIEDFTTTISYDIENGLTGVNVNGAIEGLENVNYGTSPNDYSITTTKYVNASGFWNCLKPKLVARASVLAGITLNPNATNFTVAHNPTKGIINYNYQFDNRPCNYISGAITENIVIVDTRPVDIFAEVVVLGRAYGPILQDLSTVTPSRRSVSIEANMGTNFTCTNITGVRLTKPNINSLLCSLEQEISGVNTQHFKTQDQESWDIKKGRYTRNVEWVWVACGGAAPNTSFCS